MGKTTKETSLNIETMEETAAQFSHILEKIKSIEDENNRLFADTSVSGEESNKHTDMCNITLPILYDLYYDSIYHRRLHIRKGKYKLGNITALFETFEFIKTAHSFDGDYGVCSIMKKMRHITELFSDGSCTFEGVKYRVSHSISGSYRFKKCKCLKKCYVPSDKRKFDICANRVVSMLDIYDLSHELVPGQWKINGGWISFNTLQHHNTFLYKYVNPLVVTVEIDK